MLRGYWYLVVINYDIVLFRLFDFHVAETCRPMLTGFCLMYMASSLSWLQWLLCAIEYFAQCISIY